MSIILNLDIQKVNRNVRKKAQLALTLVGAAGVTAVQKQLHRNKSVKSGNLLNSITYSTNKDQKPVEGKTDGTVLTESDLELGVKIGTTVVYAPRLEFGFLGKDSLGRNYNQVPKPFLRTGLRANKEKLQRIFSRAMKNG